MGLDIFRTVDDIPSNSHRLPAFSPGAETVSKATPASSLLFRPRDARPSPLNLVSISFQRKFERRLEHAPLRVESAPTRCISREDRARAPIHLSHPPRCPTTSTSVVAAQACIRVVDSRNVVASARASSRLFISLVALGTRVSSLRGYTRCPSPKTLSLALLPRGFDFSTLNRDDVS